MGIAMSTGVDKPAIVVAGSLNMDFVVRVERLPAAGQTVLGADFRMTPGGKGANQAYAAARLGAPRIAVRMAGRAGYDLFADHLKASLAAAGVDTSAVFATQAAPTGVALIWVDAEGQNSIVVAPGANQAFAEPDVAGLRRTIRGAAFLLTQLETPLATVGRTTSSKWAVPPPEPSLQSGGSLVANQSGRARRSSSANCPAMSGGRETRC